jgi:type IV pilus assembly protein PilW
MNKLLEKGFSLIEFMIAIAISMIVLLAVSIAWQSGFAMQQAQTDNGRLNETVRFAIDLLSREIRQAGLINKATNPPELNFCSTATTLAAIAGINDPTSGAPSIDPTITGMNFAGNAITVANLSDAIRVRYYGEDQNAGGLTGGTGPTTDCLGNTVPSRTLVEDTLYVAADPNNNGEPALWCYTNNPNSAAAPSQPIVSGVESLQILYGLDTDGDGIVNQYIPWQLIPNSPANNLIKNSDGILSVKVSIVARSANAVTTGSTVPTTYYHFGSTYVDPGGTSGAQVCVNPPLGNTQCAAATQVVIPNDNRLRLPQPVSTEIAIRNFSNCSVQF